VPDLPQTTIKQKKLCNCGQDLDEAKRKRKAKYWIHYQVNNKQYREAAGYSIQKARDSEGKRRSQRREGYIFEKLSETKMTFQQLTDWYLELETVKSLAYFKILKYNLSKFNSKFGEKIIKRIQFSELEDFQAKLKKQYSASYIDKIFAAAKSVINKAYNNNLVSLATKETFRKVGKVLKRNANARDIVLTHSQYQAIFKHLPFHLKPVFATGYYTGMRKGEILNLKWDRIDLKNRMIRLKAEDTKDNEPRDIPICNELFKILKQTPGGGPH
jgi:integrase